MKIEMWADVVCPWCGLGDHRLRLALEQFEHADELDVVHRSFQLDPTAPEGAARPTAEVLSARGYDPDQLAAATERIEALAADDGLSPYRVADALTGSTALVHELLAHISETGDGHAAWQHVYRAHFGEGRDIFTVDGLVDLAADLGIDADEARAVLTDRRHRDRVRADQDAAASLGVRGVPFVLIDGRIGVSGAQPVATLVAALDTAWADAERDASSEAAS